MTRLKRGSGNDKGEKERGDDKLKKTTIALIVLLPFAKGD
jgi:hypothetical protein